jgi:ATP-dependent DNA ligase
MKLDRFTYFYPERPRLLHIEQPLFESLSQDPNWVAEPKYNGSRLQLHYLDGAWQFWNRHGQPMDYRPSLR